MTRVLYIVGGPPRVGKSALGRRVMEDRGVPWLSTDIVRTVVRSADRQIDELDRGHADPDLVAERMYPYLERAVDVALGQCETFLIEGVEWFPRHVAALGDRFEDVSLRACFLGDVSLRACFLGDVSYSLDDLASYEGMNRWHDDVLEDERRGLPRWIRDWSDRLRAECAEVGERYIDVGELGFDRAMVAAERSLFVEPACP